MRSLQTFLCCWPALGPGQCIMITWPSLSQFVSVNWLWFRFRVCHCQCRPIMIMSKYYCIQCLPAAVWKDPGIVICQLVCHLSFLIGQCRGHRSHSQRCGRAPWWPLMPWINGFLPSSLRMWRWRRACVKIRLSLTQQYHSDVVYIGFFDWCIYKYKLMQHSYNIHTCMYRYIYVYTHTYT